MVFNLNIMNELIRSNEQGNSFLKYHPNPQPAHDTANKIFMQDSKERIWRVFIQI